MGTSIAAAIDYLVANLPAPLTAVDPAAVVVDGIAASVSESMVVIGRPAPQSTAEAASGSQVAVVLGMNRESEDYDIPCFAYAFRPGPAVKPARDAAVALFNAVAHLVAGDRTLGGVLLQGRAAQMSSVTVNQDVDDESGAQVIVWISFSIHCQNHYTP